MLGFWKGEDRISPPVEFLLMLLDVWRLGLLSSSLAFSSSFLLHQLSNPCTFNVVTAFFGL